MSLPLRPLAAAAALALLSMAGTAAADEQMLGYTPGVETLPQGASEAYLWITHKEGKRRGDYARDEIRAEFEHGFTDTFSASVYLNGYRYDYDCGLGCAGPLDDPEITGSRNDTRFSGISVEAKKMLSSPFRDKLGVALYGEVTYDSVDSITGETGQGWEVETKLILQKSLADDQLQWVTNIELEAESWRADGESRTEYAVAPRLRTGLSYRFAPNWFVGVEGWADVEALNPVDGSWEFDHWDAFAGPSLHYGAKRWWATASWVSQLAGSNESEDNHLGRHYADHEGHEFRVKLGVNF